MLIGLDTVDFVRRVVYYSGAFDRNQIVWYDPDQTRVR